VYPDNDLSYPGNFLNMLDKMAEAKYQPNPVKERALDILFILHADHEQNCGTNAMRAIGSSMTDPYSAMAGAAAALYGPLHGGANEEVLRMLSAIGHVKNVPSFIEKVKSGEGRLMGFGHRVYKNYDPRAKIIKRTADEVFAVTGVNPLLEIALELEHIALQDDYFVSRKLYPNVDFYSGLIYQALGFPVEMFPVLFAIPRTVGWLAQWVEMINDADQKIARPRQIYLGYSQRDYAPMDNVAIGLNSRRDTVKREIRIDFMPLVRACIARALSRSRRASTPASRTGLPIKIAGPTSTATCGPVITQRADHRQDDRHPRRPAHVRLIAASAPQTPPPARRAGSPQSPTGDLRRSAPAAITVKYPPDQRPPHPPIDQIDQQEWQTDAEEEQRPACVR
jgi:hypothetical protein